MSESAPSQEAGVRESMYLTLRCNHHVGKLGMESGSLHLTLYGHRRHSLDKEALGSMSKETIKAY